VMCIKF